MSRLQFAAAVLSLALAVPGMAAAQGAQIALGTAGFDSSQPVEVAADALSVDQQSGEAVFDGNVLVVQGEVRLSAGRIVIEYATGTEGGASGIARLVASGGVTFVTPGEAAEAAEAVYDVAAGQVELTGGVLLTQGQTAIAGDRLTLDLASGKGQIEGRVRTVIGAGQ